LATTKRTIRPVPRSGPLPKGLVIPRTRKPIATMGRTRMTSRFDYTAGPGVPRLVILYP